MLRHDQSLIAEYDEDGDLASNIKSNSTYIRLDFFCHVMNQHIIEKNENGDRARFKTGKDITDLNEQGLSPEISEIIKILKEQNIKIPGSETDPTAINTSGY